MTTTKPSSSASTTPTRRSVRDFTRVDVVNNGVKSLTKGTKSFFAEFVEFLNRGPLLELAIAVILGAAFSAIVNSLVTEIITPILALIVPTGGNLQEQYVLLRSGSSGAKSYASLSFAKADGAVTLGVGSFLNNVIYFILVAFVIFIMLRILFATVLRKKPQLPSTQDCLVCKEEFKLGAMKCPHCHTVVEDGKGL